MKTIILILMTLFLVACKEDGQVYDEETGRVCDDSIRMPICLQNGSKCVSECGTKLGNVYCYYTQGRIVAFTLSSGLHPSNEESCDLIFANVYEWSKYKVDTYGH